MRDGRILRLGLEYWAARTLLGILGHMPRKLAVAAGRLIALLAYVMAGRLRAVGFRNLQLAFPALGRREHARILRGCFDSLGRQLGEFSQFPHVTSEQLRSYAAYDGLEHIVAAEQKGQGIIFLTSHIGSWELMSFAHSAFGRPLSFLVRRIDNEQVEAAVESIRIRFGNGTIDKKLAARSALRVLREGRALGILADLNTHPREGVFVRFFGREASTTASVAVLALRTGATVLPCCAIWEPAQKKFIIRVDPPLEIIRTGDRDQDVHMNTARFTQVIEDHIRSYPAQWLWIHRRWKTRPPGEEDLYTGNGFGGTS